MKSAFLFLLVWLMTSQYANAQVSVELLNFKVDKSLISPEIYFKFKLQDTIFQKHEGLGFKNVASVQFEVDGKGVISNIAFSISTDSLLKPHITNVLQSTNQYWVIKQNGKRIKDKVTLILPMFITLRPHTIKLTSSRVDGTWGVATENMEWEASHIFQFDPKDDNWLLFYRNPVKYAGIVLNPIEINVPSDPSLDNWVRQYKRVKSYIRIFRG